MRNAIMSGYGRATIVDEARECSARIQARHSGGRGHHWPADLIGHPVVHVASSTAEVMSIVEDIAAGPKEIDALFPAASRT